ncbi:GNAT family N-acetyltransferase [Pyxidicoccus fallax]|uniref:GNAT family N-acetyltransferase n=1 Tax=Pyxidicoccus fallax TaxID=394095 RepID=A0A848LI32_9BACT|nr:GNAT family N-acetyltransferase [Pyxidicoccus fallax]NMO17208.1 GNAT family N-acetyltransferase [Pyxidicoccus fallax]NPC79186.1 GNAT family N-acetyltransferase [Pyxidicoccus fallax]
MHFQPLQVPLRDGRSAVIREATANDAAALFVLDRAIVRARQGIVKHEDELPPDAATFADQRERAGLTKQDGSAFPLVVEGEGGALLGEASILRIGYRMLRHVGVLGIGVHPEAQGLGVGRLLMRHLLQWVRAHRDADGQRVLRVELHVRADNARAIALYRALGFTHEGTRRAFLRADDGTLVDDFLMGLLLTDPEGT